MPFIMTFRFIWANHGLRYILPYKSMTIYVISLRPSAQRATMDGWLSKQLVEMVDGVKVISLKFNQGSHLKSNK